MPASLRSRVAMIALLAAFLIPLGTSSLRGLTHILTCRDEAEIPFTVVVPERGEPVIVSSQVLSREAPEGVCGGLVLDMAVGPAGPNRVRLRLPITNQTDFDWHGTVRLEVGSTEVPVDIGEIKHGETAVDSITVRVRPGEHELHGSLLLGP
ncbi:MAG TPA: hypothetical protein VFV35_01085 [Acidimicrobiales bacterium]|nr:hypothetical protein [Acidimicrobiales bacterium]